MGCNCGGTAAATPLEWAVTLSDGSTKVLTTQMDAHVLAAKERSAGRAVTVTERAKTAA